MTDYGPRLRAARGEKECQDLGFEIGAKPSPRKIVHVSPPPKPKPRTFSGNGTTNLGTITITQPSTISWVCPTCSSAAFAMSSFDKADDTDISIDAQTSSGTSQVSPGSYPNVSVVGYGNWSIKITPNG